MAFYSVLNQIFYPNKKFDNPDSILLLEPYMFFSKFSTEPEIGVNNLKSVIEPILYDEPKVVPVIEKNNDIKKQKAFSPKKQDSLFWCAYVCNYGEAEYWEIGNRYKNTEMTEKQKIIEVIRKNPVGIKTAFPKMSNVKIQEIMSELMLDKKTSISTFYSMCFFYEFSALLINNKTFIEITPKLNKLNTPVFLFTRNEDGHFSCQSISDEVELLEIKTKYIQLENDPIKPLKSIANYKLEELKHMTSVLDINSGEKWKKQDFYDSILERCKW